MEKIKDHYKGSDQPSVLLTEYGDFECPYTTSVASDLDDLLKEFSSDLASCFRHFPLVNIHLNAGLAAMAAEAAGLQNKFWEMHHLLMQNHDSLSNENISNMAISLSLNMDKFNEDLESEIVWDKIQSDIKSGVMTGVNSTPTFFINDEKYEGSSSYEPLREAILEELQRSGSSVHREY